MIGQTETLWVSHNLRESLRTCVIFSRHTVGREEILRDQAVQRNGEFSARIQTLFLCSVPMEGQGRCLCNLDTLLLYLVQEKKIYL